jgi:uncharacterized damage-inducible protein DinB
MNNELIQHVIQPLQESFNGEPYQFNDSIISETVAERKYKFKVLLYGMVQHEAYHAGQIAYVMKLLRG